VDGAKKWAEISWRHELELIVLYKQLLVTLARFVPWRPMAKPTTSGVAAVDEPAHAYRYTNSSIELGPFTLSVVFHRALLDLTAVDVLRNFPLAASAMVGSGGIYSVEQTSSHDMK